jgi:hypothetical protein
MINKQELTTLVASDLLHPEMSVRKHPELLFNFYYNLHEMSEIYIDINRQKSYFVNIHTKFLSESIQFLNDYKKLNESSYNVEFCQSYVTYHYPFHTNDEFCYYLDILVKESEDDIKLWKRSDGIMTDIFDIFKK